MPGSVRRFAIAALREDLRGAAWARMCAIMLVMAAPTMIGITVSSPPSRQQLFRGLLNFRCGLAPHREMRHSYQIGISRISVGSRDGMIICSCNIISDHDIRLLAADDATVCTVGDVYRRLGGCGEQCFRCARSIKAVLDEVRSGCRCNGACHSRMAERDAGTAGGRPLPLLEAAE